MKNPLITHFTTLILFTGGLACSANAVLIAGVDFEDGAGGFDRTPDDLNLLDNISVSTGTSGSVYEGWTLQATGNLRNDTGSNTAGAFEGNFAPRLGSGGAWSITIPDTVILDLTNVSFQVRAATGSTGAATTRDVEFNTSLDGATLPTSSTTPKTGDIIFSSGGLNGRPTWTPVSVDLTDLKYKGLTDQTVYFHFYTNNAIDIDAIQVYGDFTSTVVPEPSTTAILALGGLTFILRRRR